MNITDLLKWQLSDDIISQIGKESGIDNPDEAKSAADGIINLMLTSLSKNTSSNSGLDSLINALDRDHNGGILDDMLGMVLGTSKRAKNSKTLDGDGILSNLLGGRNLLILGALATALKIKPNNLLKMATRIAPIVLAVLGRARKTNNLNPKQLTDFIKSGLDQKDDPDQKKKRGLLEKLIDSNDDGSVVDDLGKMGWNMFKKMV